MTPEEELQTRIHISQHKTASFLQTLSIIAGLFFAIWHGWPSILAGLGGAWLFHLAKPAPSDALDDANGRK